MKVTILGSSGQIGAYLTEYLRKKGHEVIEFDKNFDEKHDMTVISCLTSEFLSNSITSCPFLRRYSVRYAPI